MVRTVTRRNINSGLRRSARLALRYGPTVYRALSQYSQRSSGRTSTNASRQSSAPAPITAESDWRSVYKRRPYPRRRRRQWVRFVRKTKAVIAKSLAPSFLVRLRSGAATANPLRQNYIVSHTVLGAYGSQDVMRDILSVAQRVNELSAEPTSPLIDNLDPSRFCISGWMCETQLMNGGETTAYIDCYYWMSIANYRETSNTTLGGVELGDLWYKTMFQSAPNFPTGGSPLDPSDYGVTPYQSASLAKYIRIYKKTRIKLSPGATAQLETRSGKDNWINVDYAQNYTFLKGKTQGIFMIFYGTPGADGAITASTIRFNTNVNYTYRIQQQAISSGGTMSAP